MNHIWKCVQSASKHIYISNLELCYFPINKNLKAFSTTLNIIITLEEIIVFLKLNTLIVWMLLPKMWKYKTSSNLMCSVFCEMTITFLSYREVLLESTMGAPCYHSLGWMTCGIDQNQDSYWWYINCLFWSLVLFPLLYVISKQYSFQTPNWIWS